MHFARAAVEIVDHLPANRAAAMIHREGLALFLIAEDRPLTEVAEQLAGQMQGAIDSGTWTQHWGGPGEPPQHLRSVS